MIKYVLMNTRTTSQFSSNDRQQMKDKLHYLESESIDLDEFIVTIIDVHKSASKSQTARSFLEGASLI